MEQPKVVARRILAALAARLVLALAIGGSFRDDRDQALLETGFSEHIG